MRRISSRAIRAAAITLALAIGAQAETVYLSAHGKAYHARQSCMALSHTSNVLQAERKDAEAHGLKPCAICYRPAKAKRPDNGSWAKGGK